MKKILVTSDLSEESKAAFPVAREFAEAFSAEVLVLAIIEDPAQSAMLYALDFPVAPKPDVQQQLRDKIQKDIEELCKDSLAELPVTIFVKDSRGRVHIDILSFVEENEIDLVVMATHGRTGLSRILIGGVTEKVIRECPCPILTVRSTTANSKSRSRKRL